ncbi:MAG: response regulator [Calditrichia bacterium]
MLEQALTQNRWDVHIVNTSEKAHHLAQLRKPGLIISGTKLPDGSGVDLLKELRRHSNAPFLFLTEDRNKALIQSQVKNYGNVFFTDSQAIPDILRTVQEIREQFGQ